MARGGGGAYPPYDKEDARKIPREDPQARQAISKTGSCVIYPLDRGAQVNRDTRAPKLLGDFGEGLATYVLMTQGFEVAVVDHVGADLIAEREGTRIAVSVKTRLFRKGSKEHRSVTIEDEHLRKLKFFADRFGMSRVFIQVVSLGDTGEIHVFLLPIDSLEREAILPRNKAGFALRFHRKSDILRLSKHASLGYALYTQVQFRPIL
jgi:Holliday junction resolvase-like predicted endonuclease